MPYKAYFEAASEALIIVGQFGSIIEANSRASALFGYGPGELEGQKIEQLLPRRLRKIHEQHRQRYFDAPRTRRMGTGLKLVGCRKDGQEFPVEVALTFAATDHGDVVVACISDISERVALEREASRADVLASLASAAAGIAHDIKNPLQVIAAQAGTIKALHQVHPTATVEDRVDIILRQCEHVARIVDDLLLLAKNGMTIDSEVNLNELVESALLLIREQVETHNIQVELSLEADLPSVLGHPVALERVVMNLLTNAMQVLPEGGRIGVRTEPGAKAVHLTVTDDGPGIAAEAVDHIFDLLYTTKAEGTGLGLWLARRIIQQHQGTIEVASSPGSGATFMIKLPIAS